MKNTLFVNHDNRTIVMDRTFARYAANTKSEEYAHLQQVRQDYPTYEVVQRHIKTNANKNTYKGLNYEYMEDYIMSHGDTDTRLANMREYNEKRLISECHSKPFRYPIIKSWFLNKFPEIAAFGTGELPLVFEQGHYTQIENANPERLALAGTTD